MFLSSSLQNTVILLKGMVYGVLLFVYFNQTSYTLMINSFTVFFFSLHFTQAFLCHVMWISASFNAYLSGANCAPINLIDCGLCTHLNSHCNQVSVWTTSSADVELQMLSQFDGRGDFSFGNLWECFRHFRFTVLTATTHW